MLAKLKGLFSVWVFCLLGATATSAPAEIVDDFTRPDSDTLGQSKAGSITYVESNNTGGAGNTAKIAGERLLITGDPAAKQTGRVFLSGYESADLTVSLRGEFKSGKPTPDYGKDNVRNTLGVMLRLRQKARFGAGSANDDDSGFVSVEFMNNGQVLVRERQANGTLIGIGKKPVYSYTAGSLGAKRNEKPYDVDDDGMLEEGEPFDLSVSLAGTTITVNVNGTPLFAGATTLTAGKVGNGVALLKGMPSSKYTLTSDLYIDDLEISPLPEKAPATSPVPAK